MANNTANIKAVITAEDKASKVLAGVGHSFSKILKASAISAAAVGAGAIAFGVSAVKSFEESENAAAQLNAVLKSTGGAAGVTAQQADGLATSLQKVTRFSDETILGGENLLLTFTKIGKDIFPQATETMLNMSQALGQDVKSSAVQLGKALQDPILGVTALRRVGVNFSQAQQDVIKNLVDTGKSAEAQKLILKELEIEFGNSARAAGTTFAGKLDILKNSFDDIKESIGKVVVDVLVPLVTKFSELMGSLDWSAIVARTEAFIVSLQATIIGLWQSIYNYLAPGVSRFLFIIQEIWTALSYNLMPALRDLANAFTNQLYPQLKDLWDAIEPGFTTALKALGVILVGVVIAALYIMIKAMTEVMQITGFAIQIIRNLITWFGNLGGAIYNFLKLVPTYLAAFWQGIYNQIISPFVTAFNFIMKIYNETLGRIFGQRHQINIDVNAQRNRELGIGSYATGGFTGRGGANDVAGIVHKGEYVIPKSSVDQSTGMPKVQIGGGGGTNVNVTFSGIFTGNEMEFRKLAIKVFQAAGDVAGMQNNDITAMTTQNWRRA